MQMKLIFTRKILHLGSFWKWEFLALENGLSDSPTFLSEEKGKDYDVIGINVLLTCY